MSRCPVLETGRNSVMPSMMPRITVLRVSDTLLGLARPGMRGRHLNRAPAISQQAGEILQLEAAERGVVAARQRYELERLAHLLRHDEAPCLAREVRALRGVRGLRHQLLEPRGQQKRRLGGKAAHGEI